jgi:hypothetical protein
LYHFCINKKVEKRKQIGACFPETKRKTSKMQCSTTLHKLGDLSYLHLMSSVLYIILSFCSRFSPRQIVDMERTGFQHRAVGVRFLEVDVYVGRGAAGLAGEAEVGLVEKGAGGGAEREGDVFGA